LETIVNGLQGLLGYEMIMRKGKLEELLKKLKYYLYCDSAELQMFGKKLGDYIINPKLCNYYGYLRQCHNRSIGRVIFKRNPGTGTL
jgi:hypothetical protein